MTDSFKQPLFLDSGAHGLYADHVLKKDRHTLEKSKKFAWYTNGNKLSKEFKEYLDHYGKFIQQNEENLDLYANVDAIFNPELTWKAQQYLEKTYGIIPLPVIHYGTDLKWLRRYLDKGYEYIALGGLGQEISQSVYRQWADTAFDMICDQPSRKPLVKVHGFAMTAVPLMRRYPWYSVDSTSWLMFGSYGQIITPPRVNGKWVYDRNYLIHRMSVRPWGPNKASLVHGLKPNEQESILEYIAEKGFVVGSSRWENGEEIIEEPGLCNDDKLRTELNAMYFIDFNESLPTWPWAFEKSRNKKIEGF